MGPMVPRGRYLVYSPGLLKETLDDAKVSRLGGSVRSDVYPVTYLPDEQGIRRLRIGEKPVRLRTYADLQSLIWQKVWPDLLPDTEPRP